MCKIFRQTPGRIHASTAFESDGLMSDLKKALAERISGAEIDGHLADQSKEVLDNYAESGG